MDYEREELLVLNSLANAFEDKVGVNNPKTTLELVAETEIGQEASCECKYAVIWKCTKIRTVIARLRKKGYYFFNETLSIKVFDTDSDKFKIIHKRCWFIPTQEDTINRIINKGKKVYKGVGNFVTTAQRLAIEVKQKGILTVVTEQRKKIAVAIQAK